MDITKVKWWKKTVKGDTVQHVRVAYTDAGKDLSVHDFGDNAEAAPKFYKAFKAFSPLVAKAIGVPDKMATGLIVDTISTNYSEDKEGNENTKYSLSCKVKAGHASAVLNITINHKYIPEGFEVAIGELNNAAYDYIKGIRAQTELPLDVGEKEE